MSWTRHGHWTGEHDPTPEDFAQRPRVVARCGGPALCPSCALDAARADGS